MSVIERMQQKVPCLMSRRTSFILMTFLLGFFFLIEVVVGYITNSMALIADSFHMLSDVASLIVGYLALKYSTEDSPRDIYTYGYARAEVLGALVNAVFLVALCFSIFIEALKRLVILEGIDNPDLVFFVGLAGLIVNIFGMFLFHQTGHGHSHGGMSHSHSHGGSGGHGHSHGKGDDHGHSHSDDDECRGASPHEHSHGNSGHGHSHGSDSKSEHPKESTGNPFLEDSEEKIGKRNTSPDSLPYPQKRGSKLDLNLTPEDKKNRTLDDVSDIEHEKFYANDSDEKSKLLEQETPRSKNTAVIPCDDRGNRKPPPTSGKSAGHLNIEGVYLHILGDALGSIIVMISALFLIYGHGVWTLYVDPSMSIIMVIIILKTSIPLLMETSKILMNSAPQHIHISDLRRRLLTTIPEIKNIHELHVWQLAGDKIIASVHVKFQSPDDYDETAAKIKDFFHDEGIHSTTVQIEFERNDDIDRRGQCMVVCSLDSACDEMMCCKPEQD